MSNSQLVATSGAVCLSRNSEEKKFWQVWQEYRDYLYSCCLKWMGGNPTDAEDALSRATIKAWEKLEKFEGKIKNFKSWLTSLTHNLCMDIHRERDRSANLVEDIEVYAAGEEREVVSCEDTPESALEKEERKTVIRRAIDNLPTRLRETFILHFDRELSYKEIAQQQEISYQNVSKRISQARAILREELRGYFLGENETKTELSVKSTKAGKESGIGEKSQENGRVEPIVAETVRLSVAVEEVEIKPLVKEEITPLIPPCEGGTLEGKLLRCAEDFCLEMRGETNSLSLVRGGLETRGETNSLSLVRGGLEMRG
ncbi:RNA polymerase sigma factor, partial [Limnofasciculus baicalensis]